MTSDTTEADKWRRRYERERNARSQAESLLESKSHELYHINKQLSELFQNLEQEVSDRTADLAQARDEALASARAKSDFLANMSHEIRTPLNGVMGMLYSLRRCKNDDQRAALINSAIESGKLLLSVISDILDFSKIESVGIELESIDFDLRHTLEVVAHNFAASARQKGLDLITEIDPMLPNGFRGDGFRIQQVIGNFISNAIKFTERGRILVSADYLGEGRIQVAVSDTGAGIEPEQAKNIFNAFSQADTSVTRCYGGTGLGLSICARIVDALGATIDLDSTPGEGSRFSFTLTLPVVDYSSLASICRDQLQAFQVILLSKSFHYRDKIRKLLSRLNIGNLVVANEAKEIDSTQLKQQLHSVLLLDLSHISYSARTSWLCLNDQLPNLQVISLVNFEDMGDLPDQAQIQLLKPVRGGELIQAILDPESSSSYGDDSQQSLDQSALHGLDVLIVDDNLINRQVATTLLRDLGCEVTTCDSGPEAIAYLQVHSTDLVLMDVQMPGMDGLQATRHIRQMHSDMSDVPVIAMTAHAQPEDRRKSFAAGMQEHLTKPLDPETLRVKIAGLQITARARNLKKQPQTAATTDARNDHVVTAAHTNQSNTPRTTPLFHYLQHLVNHTDFEIVDAIERLGGREELLLKLLTKFVEEFSKAPCLLIQHLQDENYQNAKALVHQIKGSASNLGAKSLSDAAAAIEHRLKQGEHIIPDELLRRLANHMKTLIEQIPELPSSIDNTLGQKVATGEAPVAEEEVLVMLKEIGNLLEQDIVAAEHLFAKLDGASLKYLQEPIAQLGTAMRDYEIDTAKMIITDILTNH